MEKSSSLGNIRASRIKELIKREGITQEALALKLPVTSRKGQDPTTMMDPQNLSRCLTSGKVSEKLCRKINKAYPEYRIGWLLGYEEHATQKEELLHKVEKLNENGSLLWKGFLSFASLSGFHTEIASIPGEKFMDTFKNMKEYCTISRDGKSITLSMAELNSFTEELCDYVEFRLTHMMK